MHCIFAQIVAMKTKKYLVLGILFVLPILVYLFFASGVNNFAKLPILTENVASLESFQLEEGETPKLEDHITVLGFFGNSVDGKKANAFNLAHKIYKKNYEFQDFQFLILATPDQANAVLSLKEELKQIADPVNYRFAFGTAEDIKTVFGSLKTNLTIDTMGGSDYVFLIDKQGNLRGRTDDEDVGKLYGFNATDYAEINNKMGDDVKILLAEYRLALKKYKAERKI